MCDWYHHRIPWRVQAVRRCACRRGLVVHCRTGGRDGVPGTQRSGQDHIAANAAGVGHAHRRNRHVRRDPLPRPRSSALAGWGRHSRRRASTPVVRRAITSAHSRRRAASRPRGWMRCSCSPGSRRPRIAGSAASRWGCGSVWASHPRCSATPECSCSTSRSTGSTPRASAGSATGCGCSPSQGRTVLVSSHLLSEVQQTVDRVVIISRGRIVHEGSLDTLEATSGVLVDSLDRARARRCARRPAARCPCRRHPGRRTRLRPRSERSPCAAGIALSLLVPQRAGLEDVFLELVGDRGGDRHMIRAIRVRGASSCSRCGCGGSSRSSCSSTSDSWPALLAFAFGLGHRERRPARLRSHRRSAEGTLPPLIYSVATAVGYVIPLILGTLSSTGEVRYQTLTPTFLAQPQARHRARREARS